MLDDHPSHLCPGTSHSGLGPFMHKQIWIRAIVILVCSLSVIGSALIIFSFICFKELRSRGRQILTHISIMDLGVASSNLIGSSVYFDHYYSKEPLTNCTFPPEAIYPPSPQQVIHPEDAMVWCPQSLLIRDLCVAQASLALYFTLGSVYWSNCLSVYLYLRIVDISSKVVVYVFRFSCFVSYCLPLLVTVWLLLTGRLGFSPYESAGWCSVIMEDPSTHRRDLFASTFGYNIWIVLTFVLIPTLSLAIHAHVKKLKTIAVYRSSDQISLDLRYFDYKFLLIPVVFIGLRFWSFLSDLLHVYIGVSCISTTMATLLVVLQGIGDSGQGATNAIIFIFFTKRVRNALLCPCKNRTTVTTNTIQGDDINEDTSLLEDSQDDPNSDTQDNTDVNTSPQLSDYN